ncbi:hypothetical protein TNCV_4384331 [Trichonephila clavipes]|nr:hypothetical protein TNCV_4384331 [Trichonephila clavipes]
MSALLSIRDGNPLQAKVLLIFPKIQPCFTRYANLNPLGYKPRVNETLLKLRFEPMNQSGIAGNFSLTMTSFGWVGESYSCYLIFFVDIVMLSVFPETADTHKTSVKAQTSSRWWAIIQTPLPNRKATEQPFESDEINPFAPEHRLKEACISAFLWTTNEVGPLPRRREVIVWRFPDCPLSIGSQHLRAQLVDTHFHACVRRPIVKGDEIMGSRRNKCVPSIDRCEGKSSGESLLGVGEEKEG